MKQFAHTLRQLEVAVLAILFGLMVVLGLAQIVLRNFAGVSPVWLEPALRALVLWTALGLVVMLTTAASGSYTPAVIVLIVSNALIALSAIVAAVYYALVERLFENISPPPPPICSIYDSRFWWVERIWKLHPIHFMHLFDGTPFKNVIWRLIGVRFGKRVFDAGVYISEPTLTAIGDECVLNQRTMIQCDSQEDGTYKSGPTRLGNGCTLGVASFVHYGVTMGDGAVLAADSFLMKGEDVPAGARWGGNPAREL